MHQKQRICILVKAYPQPSQKYEETVCCAGVTEDGRFLRLYPIPYRKLKKEQQFQRFDWVEMDIARDTSDHRPESHKVVPDSIRIIQPGAGLKAEQRVRLWKPFIADSLQALKEENVETGRSLGIVKPDPGSVKFSAKPIKEATPEDQALTHYLYRQASLLDAEPLKELQKPEFTFEYRFTSGGHAHEMKIHDWEVAAACYHYKKRYGGKTLEMLSNEYGNNIPRQNLHIILGTMKAHPRQFIIIGLLRTTEDIDSVDAQQTLF